MTNILTSLGMDVAGSTACGTCLQQAGIPVWAAIPGGVLLAAAAKGIAGLLAPRIGSLLAKLGVGSKTES